ncbi:alpha-amylase family glycosyl hydrolase [Albimonas sp. CAU 1670]|uniref:alpha-amylase family glycosyl hydrolase n=1 Tax=Albimonas sp. CAU 1670 TaxID=3032599 RepID=UPI0023DBD085|nr:alpha-amylase family glycosyl hydrolase [Albimonas sp. CAU 1670]MDF2234751.1 alpha-amylase family glycosyl hydrolase [Albimonas sp. CAU 1670]
MLDVPSPALPMGAAAQAEGASFRVWAPNADAVFVVGEFNDWADEADPMVRGDDGCWSATLPHAAEGQRYRFRILNGDQVLSRIDPWARALTSSVGDGIVCAPRSAPEDGFARPDWNRLVIYEMHMGTFHRSDPERPGGFAEAVEKFDHLRKLGVNAIQVMPIAEFAGDLSWGYNPAHIFAVEIAYGGPDAFRDFVAKAHAAGFAVIMDVVYNHLGPSDLDLWQFDGWSEEGKGGIYFYNDHRSDTPWGDTRPDYGRAEVRDFIRENALHWLGGYGVDGLRFDMTLYIRTISGDEGNEADAIPEGWSLMQEINAAVADRFPGRITIAEDLRLNHAMTASVEAGGAGFGAQWDAGFVHPIRAVLIAMADEDRSMQAVVDALCADYNGDPFQRVIYTESHDEVANGQARVPHEIDGEGAPGWAAQKRSTLGAALMFTTPGIPMLFQGQEFLQGDWFDDAVPLDWDMNDTFRGVTRLYRDLIALRLDREGGAAGLSGRQVEVLMMDEARKLVVFHRRDDGREGDEGVIVALNFAHLPAEDVTVPLPGGGTWRLRLNTDWDGYSKDFAGFDSAALEGVEGERDGRPFHGTFGIGAYTALIFTR